MRLFQLRTALVNGLFTSENPDMHMCIGTHINILQCQIGQVDNEALCQMHLKIHNIAMTCKNCKKFLGHLDWGFAYDE